MNFWSDVEKEYNELSGDSQTGEDEDGKSSSAEFNGLLSDIKNDLKKIPKSEPFPSFPSSEKNEENLEGDDSDSGLEGTKRNLSKSNKEKHCRVGGVNYEVGARWKDKKTGKNMMCVLMNVPKDVQPLFSEDGNLTQETSKKGGSQFKRPPVAPQWSYTATPKPKVCEDLESGKTSEKPDRIESNSEKEDQVNKENESLVSHNETGDKENLSGNQTEDVTEKENKTIEKEPEIVVVDPPDPKAEEKNNEDSENEKDDDDNDDDDDVDDDSENEDESENKTDTTKNNATENKTPITNSEKNAKETTKNTNNEEKSDDDSRNVTENEENSQNQVSKESDKKDIKLEAMTSKDAEVSKETEDRSKNDIKINEQSHKTEEPSSGSTQEKGEPIYTKETVVVQRKLIKTEQTIETTETDKTKKEK